MGQGIQEWTKQKLWKTAFKNFEFFKGCLRKVLPGPFLDTLTQMVVIVMSSICSHGWCEFDISKNEKPRHHSISIVKLKVLATISI